MDRMEEDTANKTEGEKRGADGSDAEPPAKRTRTDDTIGRRHTDESLGMRCRVGSGQHLLSGVLKSRYTDFIVREVAEDGTVAALASTAVGADVSMGGADAAAAASLSPADRVNTGCAKLQQVGVDVAALREALRENGSLKDAKATVVLCSSAASLDKQQRTTVHTTIRNFFPRLTSSTSDGAIVASAASTDQRWGVRKEDRWPKGRPAYVHFTLYKENLETAQCLKTISNRCGVTQKLFSFAGTKDKRAVTVQRITAHKLPVEKLAAINGQDCWGSGVARVGDFSFTATQMKLGMLSGNRFSIVLRHSNASSPGVAATLSAAGERGFVNYFGSQRFGTASTPTWEVAVTLLKGDFLGGLKTILRSKGEVHKPFAAAAEAFCANPSDPAAALALAGGSCPLERGVLLTLKKDPSDPRAGFESLPRNTRCLYFHALQSLVWNEMVSARIEKYGAAKPVVGDLVFCEKVSDEEEDRARLPRVAALTSENVDSHTIFDVVLPLPGADGELKFPEHEVGRGAYTEALERHHAVGLLSGSPHVNPRTFGLFGGYRKMLQRPGKLCWRVRRYSADSEDIQKGELVDGVLGAPTDLGTCELEGELPACGEGDKEALELAFTLASSTYATMFLREIGSITST
eukprot:TRINITY_DN1170_c4_g1_i1.p1 TRINITY_DN1170_c4_g1~~TRINITY_DN1170_c4_g1_i1.p1  ORF type:complete len:634 (+),score=113.09 TRINITY_DN1170_c4_g1_i1:166-2067(+)